MLLHRVISLLFIFSVEKKFLPFVSKTEDRNKNCFQSETEAQMPSSLRNRRDSATTSPTSLRSWLHKHFSKALL